MTSQCQQRNSTVDNSLVSQFTPEPLSAQAASTSCSSPHAAVLSTSTQHREGYAGTVSMQPQQGIATRTTVPCPFIEKSLNSLVNLLLKTVQTCKPSPAWGSLPLLATLGFLIASPHALAEDCYRDADGIYYNSGDKKIHGQKENCITLDLSDNMISSLDSDDFNGLSNLQQLDLSDNMISSLDSDNFNELSDLQTLDLSDNMISSLDSDDFNGLSNLLKLELRYNNIATIEENTFNELSYLHLLDLSDNSISTIEKSTFNGLSKLQILDLHDNSISTIEENTFNGLSNLQKLDLHDNWISTIEENAFNGLSNLQTLDLSYNSISTIEENTFNGLSNLQTLDLYSNWISTIEENAFNGLSSLQTLDLNSNQITIEENLFNGLSSLQTLYLSYNGISSIKENAFNELSNLQTLDLSSNEINTIKENAFNGLSSLEKFNLSYNSISTIEENAFNGLSSLQTLDLSSNENLICLPKITGVFISVDGNRDDYPPCADTTGPTVIDDTTGPTVIDIHLSDFSLSSSPSDFIGDESATLTVTFSEEVTGFDNANTDLQTTAGTITNLTGSGTTYTATLTLPPDHSGPITLRVPADVAQDLAENPNFNKAFQKVVTPKESPIKESMKRVAQQQLARFARLASSQVMVSLENRMQQQRSANKLVVAGQQIDHVSDLGMDHNLVVGLVKADDLLTGSSFHLSSGNGNDQDLDLDQATSAGNWALWGEATALYSSDTAKNVSIRGDGLSALVGLDRWSEQWLMGIGVSHRTIDSTFSDEAAGSSFQGTLTSSLTAIHPYGKLQLNDNLELFAALGYGWGEMEIDADNLAPYTSPITTQMLGVGGRATLPSAFGAALYAKGDVLMVRSEAERAIFGETIAGEAMRSRLLLESAWHYPLASGATHSLSLESGIRYDGGDVENGFGLEIGGGWSYTNAKGDINLTLRGRRLLIHQAGSAVKEVGWSGSMRYGKRGEHGLNLSLSPSWGDANSGVDRLWQQQDALDHSDALNSSAKLAGEISYGFPVWKQGSTLTPYGGMTLSEHGRDWKLGSRLHLNFHEDLDVNLDLSREDRSSQRPEHQVKLDLETRW